MVLAKAGAMGGAGLGTQLYDVVSVGGWSMTVDGAWVAQQDPSFNGKGVEIVEDYYGEDFPVVDSGLTRQQVESRTWCWGRGTDRAFFSLVITWHGNPRSDWVRLPVADDRWWHGDEQVPRDQIYGRSIGEHPHQESDGSPAAHAGEPVCLRLQFGRFDT